MKKKSKYKTRYIYRDAVTGAFVTEAYAKRHPRTTVREKLQVPVC